LSCPIQRREDLDVAPYVPRDGAARAIAIFHDPITDMRQGDGLTSQQRTVAVAMSCHALNPSLWAYRAHPHNRKTIQRLRGHTRTVEPA
jgi:hypothetical protein